MTKDSSVRSGGAGRAEAERVARQLNEAQCEAILLWDDRSDEDRLRRMLAILTNEDMRQIRALGLANKASLHKGIVSALTPLGIAVRASLRAHMGTGG